tara:strand:+ start:1673 stop:3052 length:1380 start_codon:yes stop_codon:yes gene_type:complete
MRVELLDTTIREGEQSPNVSFNVNQKIDIIKSIDLFGVDFIELGHPVVSPDVRDAVHQISSIKTKAAKLIHGRATKSDINDAVSFNVEWLGIFFGTSDLSLKYKFGNLSKKEALIKIEDSISYAKSKNIKLRFTAEDASRTDEKFLIKVAQCAQNAGADRFSIADTVGILTPETTKILVKKLIKEIDIPIHIHCHNDFGLATSNALSALLAGARTVDVTVNGLGERSGIPSIAEIAVALKKIYNVSNNWNLEALYDLSNKIEKMSGIFSSENKPIVGRNAFTHKAGLHSRAVLKNPKTYEAFSPETIGRIRNLSIDKYCGKDALKNKLEELKIVFTKNDLDKILFEIKSHPEKRKFNDLELLEIADEVLQSNLKIYIPSEVEAIVNMELENAIYTTRITRWLMSLPQLKDVYEVAGDYDIVAHIKANSISELNSLIEEFRVNDGIKRTHTRPILKGYSN